MAALIGLFAGAWIGYLLWQDWGAAICGVAGFFAGVKISARRARAARVSSTAPAVPVPGAQREGSSPPISREAALVARVAELERRVAALERDGGHEPLTELVPTIEAAALTSLPQVPAWSSPPATDLRAPPRVSRRNSVWAWFTSGNALTRIGVVVLFFGVAFLLKYFAERFTVPIEVRLGAVAAFGVALIALGLRLASARPGYALSLQGAGAGVLYLSVYAAFRLYGVLAVAPAIVLLVAVAAFTVYLATRADSQPLAALAIAGGFLAPVLVGNDGDPLHLFGYFAVLNAAIFALAWTKSWRALNAVGFVFTFVLGAAWGAEFYDAAHYAIVQPFLALYFVFYVAMAILNVRRVPFAVKDPVDGLLVFGVPLTGFALQAALVHEIPHGVAWSAFAIAVCYAILFAASRTRAEPGAALLSRAFLALAVIFAAIAIPFALIDFVRHLPDAEKPHAVLAWVTASVALALLSSRWLEWPRLAIAGLILLPAMLVAAYFDFTLARTTLETYGWIVWPCAWAVHFSTLAALERIRLQPVDTKYAAVDVAELLNAAHAISAVALTMQIAGEASEWTGRWTARTTAWTPCAAALPAIVYLWLVVHFRDSMRWPLDAHRRAYTVGAGTPIAVLVALWFFTVNALSPGDVSPLPYFPLGNALDATLALALWSTAVWATHFAALPERTLYRWLAAGLFVGLNGVLLRTAHHWSGVPWRLSSMLASKPLQAALTLAWTLTALAVMVVASRRRLRTLWMLGAALLAVVVAKLFLVDLGALSGLPRVIAFLGAGIVLLVIGFVSPLPPAGEKAAPRDDAAGAPPAV